MNVLEDSSSDDAKDNEINVKKYIFQVLKAMAPLLSDNECHSFIDRFNKGGITLSSYHSQLGGILNFSEEKEDVLLRSSFSNHRDMRHISNTNVLIEKFINYLFVEYLKFLKDETHTDPLKNFIETLAPELTTKTQGLHDYIIRAVANKVYESNNLVKATFWHSPRVAFNRDEFIALYSLPNPGILQASENTEPARRNEIESTLLQIEEARKRRRERRVATIVEEKPAGTNTQSNVSETNNEKESNIFRSGM
jgi:hypothetical protein